MKKIYLAAALSILAAVLLTGCNGDKKDTETTEETASVSSEQEALPGNTDTYLTEETTLLSEDVSGTSDKIITDDTTAVSSQNSSDVPGETTTDSAFSSAQSGTVSVPSNNEYDILRSGTFYIKGAMIESTGAQSPLEMAVTSGSVYMLSEFSEGVDIGILVSGEKIYMIYPTEKAYVEINDAIMNLVGFNVDEMMSSDSIDFSSYGALSEAYSVVDEEYNGINCKIYSIKHGENGELKVYMSGNELIRFASYNAEGQFLSATEVDAISADVPSDKSAPPSGYKVYKGITGMFSFMSLLADEM